jgi:hypothetical protein
MYFEWNEDFEDIGYLTEDPYKKIFLNLVRKNK